MVNDFLKKSDLSLFTSGSRFSIASAFLKEDMGNVHVTFDLFIRELPASRNYFVFAGLEHFIDYLKNLKFNKNQLRWLKEKYGFSNLEMKYFRNFKFTGDVWAMPEGTIFFPNEPIIRITAPIIEAQFIEMFLINVVYLQTALASKISRFVLAANGKQTVMGFNRSYGMDAAMKATRIAKIFGAKTALSTYDYLYAEDVPPAVSSFHYFIMAFDSELEAFRAYFRHGKGKGFLLIDTYDSIRGLKNFITAAKELEKRGEGKATGIQLDSGDLYELSITARKMLDDAGLSYVKIFAMSNLDEWKVAAMEKKRAPIDVYAGVTELLTPSDAPTLELVYKLSEIKKGNKIYLKMKTATSKVSLPGRKQIIRVAKKGKYINDIICTEKDKVAGGKNLLVPIIQKGRIVYQAPNIEDIKKYFYAEKEKFNQALFDLGAKHDYTVTVSKELQKLARKTEEEITRTHYADITL